MASATIVTGSVRTMTHKVRRDAGDGLDPLDACPVLAAVSLRGTAFAAPLSRSVIAARPLVVVVASQGLCIASSLAAG